jgi:hypothetical protein
MYTFVCSCGGSRTKEFNENIIKLLKLPIEWNDIHAAIGYIYISVYSKFNYFPNYSDKKTFQSIAESQQLIYTLLSTNKVKSNPFDIIKVKKTDLNSIVNNNIKKLANYQPRLLELKKYLRKFKYLLNGFGFVEPVELSEHYKLILSDDNSTYETEKSNYLAEMEAWFNSVGEDKKTKPKVTRKKKPTGNVEINV